MADRIPNLGLARPPEQPASLYRGDVMHARLKPVGHRFTYRVMSLLIDLDRLDEADTMSSLFRINRGALFSFCERDHGPRDGSSLRAHADRLLQRHGVDLPKGRILLLCYPRVLGYVFNPLSVYYCYDEDGRLAGLIYEVRNTFGEMHSYVCPVRPHEISAAGIRQTETKAFYVISSAAGDRQSDWRDPLRSHSTVAQGRATPRAAIQGTGTGASRGRGLSQDRGWPW